MDSGRFERPDGSSVTAVTAAEMRSVDRVAVEEFGLALLQMMENAGRTLASQARSLTDGAVTVLAGDGGNGGGGLCAARHLANRGVDVSVVLDRPPGELTGAAETQYETVSAMGVPIGTGPESVGASSPDVLVDALVGYGLSGPLRGPAADLVERVEAASTPVLSLDVPSGLDATTGDRPGVAVSPERVLTLALPKTGLAAVDAPVHLADISVPAGVYDDLDIPYDSPFGERDSLPLRVTQR